MNLNQNIIPRGVDPNLATVRPFDFAVRTLLDYDANFMQDRVVSEVFVNGQRAGVYAAARVDEDRFGSYGRAGARAALETYGPELERVVIDEFMGLGYRKRVQTLENQVRDLKAFIDRPRWWQIRRLWAIRKAARAEDDE